MEPERLGKYELLEHLGQGGMGEVWKARDTQLRRFVAIKLLHADLQAQPGFVAHFMHEARLVASLHHPNIVQIHDFELINTEGSRAKAYMVMDYIEGGTLADYIRDTISKGFYPPAADIVDLFASIGLALDYAHGQGMIHRDIKPANILLDRSSGNKALGEPVLTDFGIARLQGASSSTVTSNLIGTPRYISPEQAEGRDIDARADLYSLGIVLYEILTGVPPFRADSPLAIMMQQVHEKPAPPDTINPRIPPALSAVVLQSIAKDPQGRFPSATAMTIGMAQAFNVPLPESLSRTRSIQPVYNPLQPSRPAPGLTPYPPTLIAPSSPSAVQTPPSTDLSGSPVNPMPSGTPAQPLPGTPARSSPRRWLLISAIACALLALLVVSAFTVAPLLFSAHSAATPDPNGAVVGQIVFVSSAPVSSASSKTFEQLRVDLSNIKQPPAQTIYYAWLGNSRNENELANFPHWQLQVSNGAIHGLYSSNPPHSDLYGGSDWFLITAESLSNPPSIPIPLTTMHFYYALISHTATTSPTFDVRECPTGSNANSISPCR